MKWIANLPLRKLCALSTLIFTFVVVIWSLRNLGDVPPGTVTILMGLDGISVGGYIGSSSYEAVRTQPWSEGGNE